MYDFFIGFKNQGILGLSVCIVIVVIVFIYWSNSRKLAAYFKKLTEDIKDVRENGKAEFDSPVLASIRNSFVSSIKRGTENVNTQVIVNNNMPKKMKTNYELLEYCNSVVIVLGLFGTFLGLTMAVMGIVKIFGSNNVAVQDLEVVFNSLFKPFTSISSAFYTSITGIIASIAIKVTGLCFHKAEQDTFYDNIEDYLDNVEFSKHENSNSIISKFTRTLESEASDMKKSMEVSMKYMSDTVAETFKDGIKHFADRIEYVSVDLRDSGKILTATIDKLENSIDNFSKPAMLFKNGVDEFRLTNEAFNNNFRVNIIEMGNLFGKIENSLSNVAKAFNENQNRLLEANTMIRDNVSSLESTYSNLNNTFDRFDKAFAIRDELLKENISKLASIHGELNNAINLFAKEIEGMSSIVSDKLNTTLGSNLYALSEKITEEVSGTVKDIREDYSMINEKSDYLGSTLKSLGELLDNLRKEHDNKEALGLVNSISIPLNGSLRDIKMEIDKLIVIMEKIENKMGTSVKAEYVYSEQDEIAAGKSHEV
jgi:hypothetical protein